MLRPTTVVVVGGLIAITGCGGSRAVPAPLGEHPKGVEDHLAEARRHEEQAEIHAHAVERAERSPPNYTCTTDPVLDELLTSGTEPISMGYNPCVDTTFFVGTHQRSLEKDELAEADDHRRRATELASNERAHCDGLSPEDRDRSPLADPRNVAQIIPLRDGDAVRGVRLVLRPDAGLTAPELRHRIACHGARFVALGKPPTYLGADPAVVDGVRVTVSEARGQLEVRIESEDLGAATAALGRAQDLAARVQEPPSS